MCSSSQHCISDVLLLITEFCTFVHMNYFSGTAFAGVVGMGAEFGVGREWGQHLPGWLGSGDRHAAV